MSPPSLSLFTQPCQKDTRKNEREKPIKSMNIIRNQIGKIVYILLWLLGIPIPIVIVIYLLRGCD